MWPFLFPDDKEYSSTDITHHEKPSAAEKKMDETPHVIPA